MNNRNFFIKGLSGISNEVGILLHTIKLPRMSSDPRIVNYGVWQCNTKELGGEDSEGRSGSCGTNWKLALAGTIGETLERYAPAFHNLAEGIKSNYKNLNKNTIPLSEYALFHDEQYEYFKSKKYSMVKFTEDVELTWFECKDLTNGKETWLPGQFIYMPFSKDNLYVTASNSTGLASHSNFNKAILTALYECIERDSFVITWMNNIVPRKIVITDEVKAYLEKLFPKHYEWHLFDMTYDLDVPSVFGICFGETEYGKFITVGSATRGTIGDATRKVVQEIGQAIPYFRWILGEKKVWIPSDDFNEILTFGDHSVFYLKRTDLWPIFDKWINAPENHVIDFNAQNKTNEIEEIRQILNIFKSKGYNVLFKDITTPDVRQLCSFSIKIIIPQLIQLSGGYPFYFSGGKRLYEVPELLGYGRKDYAALNKYPHPFP